MTDDPRLLDQENEIQRLKKELEVANFRIKAYRMDLAELSDARDLRHANLKLKSHIRYLAQKMLEVVE